MDAEPWAHTELGGAWLGDPRRTRRAVDLAMAVGQAPHVPLPQATGTPARLTAAYRFLGNAAIDPDALRAPHTAATCARMADYPVVLAIQDTTDLDYTAHPATRDLGPLETRARQGLFVHTTLAAVPPTPAQPAVPLGLLGQRVWVRDPATYGQQAPRRSRAITAKESHKWLDGLATITGLVSSGQVPAGTSIVSVADSEADVYDLLAAPRPAAVQFVVRACQDRLVDAPTRQLWATVGAAPVATTGTVAIAAKPAQRHRPARPARRAMLTVRCTAVTLRPPRHRTPAHLPAVHGWAVWAHEDQPPAGAEPVSWLLLTSVPVTTVADILTILCYYTGRWVIEDWHRVLKTGCAIETRRLATAADLVRCLTLYSIVAWRVLYVTRLARADPDQPCTSVLEPDEWAALCCLADQIPVPPATPPSLGTAVALLARLGGHQPRPRGRPPGPTVLWRGFQALAPAVAMYRLLRPHLAIPPP
jgi:hypothetical protein